MEKNKEKLQISNLLIENYKKFKSANIFIKFNKSTKESETKVIVKFNEIVIKIKDEEHQIETSEFFKINAKFCYNLLVKGSFISFRIITTDDSNNFTTELITKSLLEGPKFAVLKLNIFDNEDTKITCSNCDHPLTIEKSVNFKRILSLPSSSMAMDEWFCHLHSNEQIFVPEQSKCFDEKSKVFEPKINDIFYSNFYFLLNQENLELNRLRLVKNSIHCKRCLQLLGEKLNSANCIKFWSESLKFNGKFFFCDLILPMDLIKKVLCNHLAHHNLSLIAKVIFESTAPNTQKKIYILLQIMDRNLKILKLSENKLKLIEVSAIKVMFLKLTNGDEEDEKTLKYWQSDINSATFEFSFKYFHTFLEYLIKESEQIPDNYRFNNGFQLSYVEV
ncbi:hypothetical protein PVAND_016584 [Polypedilum vanderplanki]|uniref:E3 ubiquitin-protein ligase E3D n=1 Tax=Polypedilum vanderplanki TaxID=319348 RepID=A0A9J6BG05_POLVA|nr:hypothetical protein PVAND_016584 [Polypedilum vanderplanki]